MKTLPFYMVLFFLLVAAAATSCRSKLRNDEVFQTLDKELVYLSADYRKMNDDMMLLLKRKVANAEEDENARNVFLQATKAAAIVKELEQFIEYLKIELVEYGQTQTYDAYVQGEMLEDATNTDAVEDVLLDESFSGKELKNKMNDAQVELLSFLKTFEGADEFEINRLDSLLNLRAKDRAQPKMLWEFKMFDALSKSAAVTILTMIQNRVLRAERVFLETCLNQMAASGLRISDFDLVSVPNNYTLALGDTFESRVFLTEVMPIRGSKILVDDQEITQEDFTGKFTTVPSKKGMHIHEAQLQYTSKKTGMVDTYEGEIRYYVY